MSEVVQCHYVLYMALVRLCAAEIETSDGESKREEVREVVVVQELL